MGHTISGAGALFGGATVAAISKIAKSKSSGGGGPPPPKGGPPPDGPPPPPSGGGGGGRMGRMPGGFFKSPAQPPAPSVRFGAKEEAGRAVQNAVKERMRARWDETAAHFAAKAK